MAARSRLFFLSVTFALLMAGSDVQAQTAMAVGEPDASPATELASVVTTFRKSVDEVNLLFTVVDGKGRFVNKLRLDDFNLLDNNRPPEKIGAFQQESDLPLRVALVIDLSGSISHRFKFEQDAAAAFLKKILRPKTDRAAVIGFNEKVDLQQDLTGDVTSLTSAVRRLQPHGETALFDALIFAANRLSKSPEAGTRRMIILISDGEDNRSLRKMHEVQEAALRAEAPIYTLSTNQFRSGEYSKGEAVLELLARYSGGELIPAHESHEVVKAFRQVEEALRSQYVLSYKPAAFQRDGNFRQIGLNVRKSNLKVECRRGYFAPRE